MRVITLVLMTYFIVIFQVAVAPAFSLIGDSFNLPLIFVIGILLIDKF